MQLECPEELITSTGIPPVTPASAAIANHAAPYFFCKMYSNNAWQPISTSS